MSSFFRGCNEIRLSRFLEHFSALTAADPGAVLVLISLPSRASSGTSAAPSCTSEALLSLAGAPLAYSGVSTRSTFTRLAFFLPLKNKQIHWYLRIAPQPSQKSSLLWPHPWSTGENTSKSLNYILKTDLLRYGWYFMKFTCFMYTTQWSFVNLQTCASITMI